MKNKIYLIIILLFTSFLIFSEDVTADKIIGKIETQGLKNTKQITILSNLTIKKGSIWNADSKKKTNDEIKKLKTLVENHEIIENYIDENTVNLVIKIEEKLPLFFVPFFTLSNSSGFKPQIKFWHFNLGGIGKVITTEVEFAPTEDLSIIVTYKDPAIAFNKNLSFEVTGQFGTSAPNYFANITSDGYPRGIPPIGTSGGDPYERWNDEMYFQGKLETDFIYQIPVYDIEIKPAIDFKYKSIRAKENIIGETPVDEIEPTLKLNLVFPLKSINSFIKPSIKFEYKLSLGDYDLEIDMNDQYYSYGFDKLYPSIKFEFDYKIPLLEANLIPYIELKYYKGREFEYNNDGSVDFSTMFISDAIDLVLGVQFKKTFTTKKVTHKFNIKIEYEQRLLGQYNMFKDYIKTFKSLFDFRYEFDLKFLELHHFKMKYLFFAGYNQAFEFNGYDIGDEPGDIEGWIGLICNFKYELPLFKVDTTKFLTKQMDRRLFWQVYWDFYVDAGLVANDEPYELSDIVISYTLGDYLHLVPALGLGTGIRVLPNFVSVEIKFNIGFDIYRILKTKSISYTYDIGITGKF